MYPKPLEKLIKSLERLPSIGNKTAERLALYVATKMNDEDITAFHEALLEVQNNLYRCEISNLISDTKISYIEQDLSRDHETVMVVGEDKDVFAFEKMGTYKGMYHVLGGLLDFSRGITDEDLSFEMLFKRLDNVKEVIIATNSTVEGEITAQFIKNILAKENLIITRLAYGLPVGADLKYADSLTLSKAVEYRKEFK